jgi:hypothetical protein
LDRKKEEACFSRPLAQLLVWIRHGLELPGRPDFPLFCFSGGNDDKK